MSPHGETLPRCPRDYFQICDRNCVQFVFVTFHIGVGSQGFVLYFPIIIAFSYHRGLAFLGTFVASEWMNMVANSHYSLSLSAKGRKHAYFIKENLKYLGFNQNFVKNLL